jgi:hypothetical protein
VVPGIEARTRWASALSLNYTPKPQRQMYLLGEEDVCNEIFEYIICALETKQNKICLSFLPTSLHRQLS